MSFQMTRELAQSFIHEFRNEQDFDIAGKVYDYLEDTLMYAANTMPDHDAWEFGNEIDGDLSAHNSPSNDEAHALLIWAYEFDIDLEEETSNISDAAEIISANLLNAFGQFVANDLMSAEDES